MDIITEEKNKTHGLFEVSIILKGIYSVIEIIGGVVIYFVSRTYVVHAVLTLTQEELVEDPKDIIAHYLISVSNDFSITSQHFIAFYLLIHGTIKLLLVLGLFTRKLWVYPLSMTVFGIFVGYQLYKFAYNHSIWLLLLSIFDCIIILLTSREYYYRKMETL
jgi:uncharacterized membrane protein